LQSCGPKNGMRPSSPWPGLPRARRGRDRLGWVVPTLAMARSYPRSPCPGYPHAQSLLPGRSYRGRPPAHQTPNGGGGHPPRSIPRERGAAGQARCREWGARGCLRPSEMQRMRAPRWQKLRRQWRGGIRDMRAPDPSYFSFLALVTMVRMPREWPTRQL
jgi:hypothetical protein